MYAKRVEDAGGKLTVTSILLKVCASALKRFPRFNASLDMEKKEIVYKKYIHIGVAVDTERGLLVPVIRHADQKGILELAVELTELAEKTRGKKIIPDELQGGNFTISNLGGIGGENFSPIVYAPQVAILGVSRARMEPVYTGDNFAPRLMLPLALSYDHRIIDGADGIRFIRWIAETLEHPLMLVFEGGE
jgi:pyruvate dehydrogenase E2 component (dihydrolipoamide acetyltransferase)